MKFSSISFSREEIEKGLMQKFIDFVIEYNKEANDYHIDMHIWYDGCTTVIDYAQLNYDYDKGQAFEFVGEDYQIMKIVQLPDNTITYAYDDEEEKEIIEEFLKEHPHYKKNEYGRWYDEREIKDL